MTTPAPRADEGAERPSFEERVHDALQWIDGKQQGRHDGLLAAGSTEADETQRYDPQPHWLIPVATPEQGEGPAK